MQKKENHSLTSFFSGLRRSRWREEQIWNPRRTKCQRLVSPAPLLRPCRSHDRWYQQHLIESDVLPIPDAETGSAENFAGNGFLTQETVLKKEAVRPYDWEKERR
ncbi:uncharacterized protein BT62DRAFT_156661 [Guyanagaster necrorhizus]|uniref:Uncharacterized protein n=1 Tax=Guyanagaster necrorhizus TaxID=856835 RepID=A0A9P7VSM8_9AGAR|nr:uncharacterized protein BT62DRAFT_156661 [Guyanagaster necrorhizus MCA 3950]KAG7446169.1 hypothetical protein BT62DRAFT_156661 [Guyanagaster necrorhizus MCA 3950]